MRHTPYPDPTRSITIGIAGVLDSLEQAMKTCIANRHYAPSMRVAKLELFLTKITPYLYHADQSVAGQARTLAKDLRWHIADQKQKTVLL